MRYFYMIIFVILGFFYGLKAQGEAALPFLLFQPSSNLHGLADSYTALPTKDSFGFYYNPAQLGAFSQTDNASFEYSKFGWLPQFHFNDLYFKGYGISLGYNFNNLSNPYPISLGIGYMRGYLNLGENIWTDEHGNELGTFNSREWYDAYSIGICFSYLIKTSIGFTYKSIVSELANINVGSEGHASIAKPRAYDLGLLVNVPINNFYPNTFRYVSFGDIEVKPITDLTIGMAIANIGDEVNYPDRAKADPLPRQAKIGYGLNIGLKMNFKDIEINMIKLQLSSEANDLLIKRFQDGRFEYQKFPGKINLYENILKNGSNSSVINRHGYAINILEMIKISLGRFNSEGFIETKTSGYTISSRGIFKLISTLYPSRTAIELLRHFDLRYSWAKYKTDPPYESIYNQKFESISLSVFGF